MRIKKLLSLLSEASIDNIIITDPKNMHYYSGFYNGEGYLLMGKCGNFLVTDSRYTEYAKGLDTGFEVCDITQKSLSSFLDPKSSLAFEDKHISYSQFVNFSKLHPRLIPCGDMALKPREIKDDSEIECIKKAAQIADKAFGYVCSIIRDGMTEKDVKAEIDCFMKRNGAEDPSFPTIVAAGERGSLPHAAASDRPLKHGDLVVMDFGCIVDGYSSDMTRTIAIGDITEECEIVYNTVLLAQKKALSGIKSGVIAKDIDSLARDIIDKAYPRRFGHALGHSVGLDIHEAPNLSPKNEKMLSAKNVVTVEPGIYIPDMCGVRIEDLVVVTDEGYENLTHSPKELIKINI